MLSGADAEKQKVKEPAALNPLAVAPSAEVAKDALADGVKLLAQLPQEGAAATAEAGTAVDSLDHRAAAAERPKGCGSTTSPGGGAFSTRRAKGG